MENFKEKTEGQMLDIWFFVGILLSVFGVILALAGIYYIFYPDTNTTFGHLNPNLWWGGIMIVSGIIFQAVSYYNRKKQI